MSNDELASWGRQLAADGISDVLACESTGPELIDRAQLLEHLSSAIAAEQARVAAAFSDLCQVRRTERPEDDGGDGTHTAGGEDPRQLRARVRSTGAQIALARRTAPARGLRIVELSGLLVHDMPFTLSALADGSLTEYRAFAIAAATRGLAREDRAEVDRRLCAEPARVAHLGDRAIEDAARRAAEDLDHGAAAERIQRAEADRHISLRRLPDAMAKVTAILPVAGAIAVRESLVTAAEAAKAAGDDRTLGQLTADTLIERTTGLADAGRFPLRIGLVMTERTLLTGDSEPAVLPGYGTVPADWARELVDRALGSRQGGDPAPEGGSRDPRGGLPGAREQVWLERLFTAPQTGQLIAMDSKARLFPASMARFLRLRDQTCRTPYCDAPPRHLDHVVPAASGGPTSIANGQCLCEHCNLTKESPGWHHTTADPGPALAPAQGRSRGPAGEASAREAPTPESLVLQVSTARVPVRPAAPSMAWVASCPRTGRRIAEDPTLRARQRRRRPEHGKAGRAVLRPAAHTVVTRTPTGHTYRSSPPGLPGSPGP